MAGAKTYTIKRGDHYCTPFPWPHFICGHRWRKSIIVKFNSSARYSIGADQNDVNKLFGLSYGFHHTDSDRIGWRYAIDRDCIELVIYSYSCGKRLATKHLCYINLGVCCRLEIDAFDYGGRREVTYRCDGKTVREEHNCSWHFFNYTLGLYFGGNVAAPHDITVEISDVS